MTITQLKENEIGNVSNIYLQAFGERETEMFVELLTSKTLKCFVVKNGKMPIGFFIIKQEEKTIEVITIAVDFNYRGQGISSKCLSFVLENGKKKGFEQVFFELDANNEKAIEAYCKLGFQVIKKKHTIKGSDLVILHKSLK